MHIGSPSFTKEGFLLEIEVAVTIYSFVTKIGSVANYVNGQGTEVEEFITASVGVDFIFPVIQAT